MARLRALFRSLDALNGPAFCLTKERQYYHEQHAVFSSYALHNYALDFQMREAGSSFVSLLLLHFETAKQNTSKDD